MSSTPCECCVSALWNLVNHLALIKAIAWISAHGLFQAELVLVGWANHPKVVSFVQRAVDLDLSITWRDDVDDAELQQLFEWCDCTIYLLERICAVAESLWHRVHVTRRSMGELVLVEVAWEWIPTVGFHLLGILRLIRDPQLLRVRSRNCQS